MKIRSLFAAVVSAAALSFSWSLAQAQALSGRWDGTIRFDDVAIEFPAEFSGSANDLRVAFFNGDERVTSTGGSRKGNDLLVRFDHYATQLRATLQDGVIRGTYGSDGFYGQHVIELRPHVEPKPSAATAPRIAGLWTLPHESKKGERAWRLIVQQRGAEVSAAILRVDGDTGLLSGRFRDGKFVLNHFDGARATTLDIVPARNGQLDLTLRGFHVDQQKFTAVKADAALAAGLPAPSDFGTHTRVRNAAEPFRFSFPDLQGKVTSNTDAKFAGKVLLINVTGSWCPNCHDEAPFLQELQQRYQGLGLEVVALDFEEAEQLHDPKRLHAFIKKYRIEYTFLLAGATDEVNSKLPQAENLNAWPTNFFIGRDGKVKAVHAGFASRASGKFHEEQRQQFIATIERLLAEGNAS